jgi:chromosome partitioning protein
MSKIIAVINQKGGVGKSTTAAALATGLTRAGKSVLAVDMDAQGNLSFCMGANTRGASVLGVLMGEVSAAAAIQHTHQGDVIASSKALAGADAYITETGREYRLREALEGVQAHYDYIVIDTPPALGVLTVNALVACQRVIIPTQAEVLSLQGIDQLWETIQPVKKYCNPALEVEGILLAKYNSRTVLSRDVRDMIEQLAQRMGTKIFTTTIRTGISVMEAQALQQSLYEYAPRAKVTGDYLELVKEITESEV